MVLYLIGGDQDKTYDICATSFAEAMRVSPSWEEDEEFLITLIGIAIEKSRVTKAIPTYDELDLLELPDAEKEPLRIVLKALQRLDFELKVRLLLRFQVNLSCRDIGRAMRMPDSQVRVRVISIG